MIGSNGNDTLVGGAFDELRAGDGTNRIILKNADGFGAQLDQIGTTAENQITGYDGSVNYIRISAENFLAGTAAFVEDGVNVTLGSVRNHFITNESLWGGADDTLLSGDGTDTEEMAQLNAVTELLQTKREPASAEVDLIGVSGELLIDKALMVAKGTSQRIDRNNAAANLVGNNK